MTTSVRLSWKEAVSLFMLRHSHPLEVRQIADGVEATLGLGSPNSYDTVDKTLRQDAGRFKRVFAGVWELTTQYRELFDPPRVTDECSMCADSMVNERGAV